MQHRVNFAPTPPVDRGVGSIVGTSSWGVLGFNVGMGKGSVSLPPVGTSTFGGFSWGRSGFNVGVRKGWVPPFITYNTVTVDYGFARTGSLCSVATESIDIFGGPHTITSPWAR
jgi:hypothetical protein